MKYISRILILFVILVSNLWALALPVQAAQIGMQKEVTPASPNIYYLGSTITYIVTITNLSATDNMSITSVQDTFPDGSMQTLDVMVPFTLLPGQSRTYFPTWVANRCGFVQNLVRVIGAQKTPQGDDPFDSTVTKSSMVISPQLTVQKTVDFNNDATFSESETYYTGSPATWKIVVTNSGCGMLFDINVSDSNGQSFGPFDLNTGVSQTFTYTTNPTANTTNTATASGTDLLNGSVISTPDSASVTVISPAISIQKTVDFNNDGIYAETESNNVGSAASWKIVVSNTGVGAVSNILVSDTNGQNFGPFNLNNGASQTFTYTTNPLVNTTNTATASGKDQFNANVGPVSDAASVIVITTGQVRVFKYNDLNNNGCFDGGDTPLVGWQFCINATCKTTDGTGFTGNWDLAPGTYTVTETLQPGWTNTEPGGNPPSRQVTIVSGQQQTVNFGNFLPPPPPTTPTGTPVGGIVADEGNLALVMPLFLMASAVLLVALTGYRKWSRRHM